MSAKKIPFSKRQKDYLHLLAFLYLRYGKTEAAETLYALLVEEPEAELELLNALGAAQLFQGKYAEALDTVQKVLQARPDGKNRKLALTLLTRASWELGDANSARRTLVESLQL